VTNLAKRAAGRLSNGQGAYVDLRDGCWALRRVFQVRRFSALPRPTPSREVPPGGARPAELPARRSSPFA